MVEAGLVAAGAAGMLLIIWVGRRVRWRTVPSGVGKILAGFVAGVLGVMVAGFGVLVWVAVSWIVAQPDWVSRVAGLGPLATASAAAVALLVGWATVIQKRRTDLRDQWWKRAQWALDHAAAGGEKGDGAVRRKIGQNAIAYLGRESALSTVDDLQFLQAAYPAALVHDVEERLERELDAPDRIKDVELDVEIDDDASGR